MTCLHISHSSQPNARPDEEADKLTFSCLRCFSNFSSRYVRLDRTGVLKGFMIFFTATFCPVKLSLAELARKHHRVSEPFPTIISEESLPNETKGSHTHRLEIRVSAIALAVVHHVVAIIAGGWRGVFGCTLT